MLVFVIWLTGLPCSGKSTIAKELTKHISNLAVLDGDEIRQWFSVTDFSKNGIIENNKRIAHIAKLLSIHNVPVCVSLVSPYHKNREDARKIINNKFIEVYLKCPQNVCEKRDTKGMYKKARTGLVKNFLGLDNRYQIPKKPEIVVDTEKLSLKESVRIILDHVKNVNK